MAKTNDNRGQQYKEWLDLVPATRRQELAKEIKDHDVNDLTSLTKATMSVFTGIIAGDISPVIAESALPFAQLTFQVLAARDSQTGAGATQDNLLLSVLMANKTEPLAPSYAHAIEATQLAIETTTEDPFTKRLEGTPDLSDWETYQKSGQKIAVGE